MARQPVRKETTKKHLARLEKERRQRRILYLSLIGVVVLVVGIIGYGALYQNVLQYNKLVAKVGNQTITLGQFQAEVRFERYLRVSQYDQINSSPLYAQFYASYLQQIISEGCDFDHAEGRALCASRARAYWDALPEGQSRDELLAYCCRVTRFTEAELLEVWRLTRG